MTGNDDQHSDKPRRAPNRNPWGNNAGRPDDSGDRGGQSPWGQLGGNRHRRENDPDGPDLEEMLRRARANFGSPFSGKSLLLGLLVLVVLWLASGIYRVQPSEHAVIQRFGSYTRTQGQPGLGYHLPWPVEKVTKLNVTLDRRIQIGFTDGGYGTAQRRDLTEESLMLTADANIVDIDVVVLWNITEAEKFIFNIRDPEQTIKRVAESAIREAVGQTRLQTIITQGRDDVAIRIQKLLQGVLDSYNSGVSIRQVLIQEATVHPEVLEAYNDVAASRQDAERFQNEATIYRNDILPKARGQAIKMLQDAEAYKQDVIARANGDAKRFIAIMDAYRTGKDVTRDRFYIETMEQVLSQANRLIIDQKQGTQGVVPVLPLDLLRNKSAVTPGNLGQ